MLDVVLNYVDVWRCYERDEVACDWTRAGQATNETEAP